MKLVSSSFFFLIGIGLNLPIVKISDALPHYTTNEPGTLNPTSNELTTTEPTTAQPEQTSVVGKNNQLGKNHGDPQSPRISQKKLQEKINECLQESGQEVLDGYLKVAEEFNNSLKNFSQPIYKDEWIRQIMIKEMFEPCSAYIQQVKNFENHYGVVDSYVFRKFLDDINPQSFNPDGIYRQVLEASDWEYEIEKLSSTAQNGNKIGDDSRQNLNQIVETLFNNIKQQFANWFKNGKPKNTKPFKQSVAIQLTECVDQKKKCLNLVGVLMLSLNPKKQTAKFRLFGGVFSVEYMKTESTPIYSVYPMINETERQQLEYLWSYHRNLAMIRQTLHDEFSGEFGHLENLQSFDSNENCGVIPPVLKTPSECAKPWIQSMGVPPRKSGSRFKHGRKRRETTHATDDDNSTRTTDPMRCILVPESAGCNKFHSVQKRSTQKQKNRSKKLNENSNEFRDNFFKTVNTKIKSYSDQIDSRDFERSACMLNEFDFDKSKKVGYERHAGLDYDKIEAAFAMFLKQMFGNAKTCDNCQTTILKEHFLRFKEHIEKIKKNIKTIFNRSHELETIKPFDANYTLGEFGYIQYFITYEIVDWKKNKGSSFECEMMGTNCGNAPVTTDEPQNVNIAFYAFYSEIKLKQTSMDEHKIVPLKYRFKQEIMENYFEYQFIKELLEAMPVEYHRQYPDNEIKDEKRIKNIINDIKYPTSDGICNQVVGLFENCYTKNGDKRHFIFLIDGSGSVDDDDYLNMKKSITSMVNYPMNGQNIVSIVEFSDTQQKLCENEIDPDRISKCIEGTQLNGWTWINEALDFVVKEFIPEPTPMKKSPKISHTSATNSFTQKRKIFPGSWITNYFLRRREIKYVVVIITDGQPTSGSVQNKVAELRRKPNVSVTGFGIGEAFETGSALQELKYITGDNRANLDEQKYRIRNFTEFERNRLQLQDTICSA